MKSTLIFALASFFAISANAQSINKLKENVLLLIKEKDSMSSTESDLKYINLKSANEWLAKGIIAYAEAVPDFIGKESNDVTSPIKDFYNAVSDDKKLRIVYWDEGSGGTVRSYCYIVFWNTAGKLRHRAFTSSGVEDTDTSHIYYTYIDSIIHVKQNSGDDLYLIKGSSGDGRLSLNQHIFCYNISAAGTFTNDAFVFKTSKKILSQISVDCPASYDKNGDHSYYTLLHFSGDKHTLFVPIFPDLDSQKEKEAERNDTNEARKFPYFIYEFDGTHFVYTKKSNEK